MDSTHLSGFTVNRTGEKYRRHEHCQQWTGLLEELAGPIKAMCFVAVGRQFFKASLQNICSEEIVDRGYYAAIITLLGVGAVRLYMKQTLRPIPTAGYNLAPGLAWSFYDGYIKVVSKGDLSSIFSELGVMTLPRIVILFPFKGEMQHNLENLEGVVSIGKIRVVEDHRGGQTMRPYEVSLYELEYDGRYYYCMLEGGLGIDHINQIVRRQLVNVDEREKQQILHREHASYVSLLEDYTISEGNDTDQFLFLIYNGVDEYGSNTTVREIVEGMKDFCQQRELTIPRGYEKRMNVTKRIKDMGHRVLVTDKLVERVTKEVDGSLYQVTLRGEFMSGEPNHCSLSFPEIQLARKALENLGHTQPGARGPQPKHVVTINRFWGLSEGLQYRVLESISRKVSTDWKRLYRTLMSQRKNMDTRGIEARILALEREGRDIGIHDTTRRALLNWAHLASNDATTDNLTQALTSVGRTDVANEVAAIVNNPGI